MIHMMTNDLMHTLNGNQQEVLDSFIPTTYIHSSFIYHYYNLILYFFSRCFHTDRTCFYDVILGGNDEMFPDEIRDVSYAHYYHI